MTKNVVDVDQFYVEQSDLSGKCDAMRVLIHQMTPMSDTTLPRN